MCTRSDLPSDDKHFENSGPRNAPKIHCIEDIEEIVRKWIEVQVNYSEKGGTLHFENLRLTTLGGNHLSPFPHKVHNAKLRVLL